MAVYLFDFEWTGRIDGREAGGAGRGTCVLVREGQRWLLLAEHPDFVPAVVAGGGVVAGPDADLGRILIECYTISRGESGDPP